MYSGALLFILFFISVISFVSFKFISYKKNNLNITRSIIEFLFLLYFFAILFFTVGSYSTSIFFIHPQLSESINFTANLIPFKETISMFMNNPSVARYNVIGNILMFIPLGVLIPALYKKYSKLAYIMLISLLLSLAIEFNQLLFYLRATDIDDIIFNTLGGVLGFIFFKVIICKISIFKNLIQKISIEKNIFKPVMIPMLIIFLILQAGIHTTSYMEYQKFLLSEEETLELATKATSSSTVATLENEFSLMYMLKNDSSLYIHSFQKNNDDFWDNGFVDISERTNLFKDDVGNQILFDITIYNENSKFLHLFAAAKNDLTALIKFKDTTEILKQDLKKGYSILELDLTKLSKNTNLNDYDNIEISLTS